jgi:serine-type D-Ala-D-Ala carboxypeptidase (penicillin-binding protein 5/6)
MTARSGVSTRPASYGRATLYRADAQRRARVRRRWVTGLVLCAAIASVGYVAWPEGVGRTGGPADGGQFVTVSDAGLWPAEGQAAYATSTGPIKVSPGQHSAPIASLAKVMTAYLVLKHAPLTAGANGPTLTVTADDVLDTERRRGAAQSVVAVAEGEQLTERQALAALLIPSANNVAAMLARQVGGTERKFVAEMNDTARRLGMRDTVYTDPSGYDSGTRSTAGDQVILAQAATRNRVFAAIVALPAVDLPVAGTVRNTDTLLGSGGFIGVKTGSHDAAGGCFMFQTRRTVHGKPMVITGVVLGQHGGDLIAAGLAASSALADRIAPTA